MRRAGERHEPAERPTDAGSYIGALDVPAEAGWCAREPDRRGEVIGSFVLRDRLGQGGMGVVYAAVDLRDDSEVAIKLLPATRFVGPGRALRFACEAKALASIDHPGIVRHIDHGTSARGEPYLVMEWLAGEDLAHRLEQLRRGSEPAMPTRDCVRFGARLAEALAAVHARGIVHRDIKPSNLFLVDGCVERVKIFDFGVARRAWETALHTNTGVALGTPGYMAPEQARGERTADERADIFSLGAVLFECLAGRPAFVGEHVLAMLARLLLEEPRLDGLRPDVPPALVDLVHAMLRKEPAARPASARAVAAALADIAARVAAAPAAPATRAAPTRDPQTPGLMGREQRFLCVVVARPAPGHADTCAPEAIRAALVVRMREEELALAVRIEALADGSLLASTTGTGDLQDQVARACRLALLLRRVAPRLVVAAVTGLEGAGSAAPGPLRDRAAALLLAASASAGSIVLDEATTRLLDARFDTRETGAGFVLAGERDLPEETRTLLGRATPCVGRDRELRTLEQLFAGCVAERTAQAVLVTAPAGVGKSRVMTEFLARVRDASVTTWIGRGDPLRAGSALGLLGQLLRRALEIQDGEPLATRQLRLVAHVRERVAAGKRQRVAEFLGELVGAPFPDEESPPLRAARREPPLMSDQMCEAFLQLLAGECAARPVMIVLEDLHWADRPTLRFLDHALRDLGERPLFVLALARPEIHERAPGLWHGRPMQEIHLGELPPRAVERLARHVLGETVASASIERLVKLSAGNALFVEELVRHAAAGRGHDLPASVVAMVHARLDALDGASRRLLRAASVFGEVFWARGVAALLGAAARAPDLDGALRELVAKEVVVARGASRFPGEAEYAFRHELLREGAYAMLTTEARALGHCGAARWLEQRGESDMLVLAGHHERGGEALRAAECYTRAADQAHARSDLDGALAHALRGLACAPDADVRGALLACRTQVQFSRGDLAAAEQAGEEAQELLAPGSLRWCQYMQPMFLVLIQRGRVERFTALARRFCAVEPDADASVHYLKSAAGLVIAWCCVGAQEAATGLLGRMERLCGEREVHDANALGWVWYAVAYHGHLLSVDPWGTWLAARAAIARFEETEDHRMTACAHVSRAIVQAELFGLAGAVEPLRAAAQAVAQLNEAICFAYVAMHLALLLATHGASAQLDEAHALATAVRERVPGPSLYGGVAACALAHVHLRRGELAAAEAFASEARALLGALPGMAAAASCARIEVLLRGERAAEARAAADEASAALTAVGSAGFAELRLRLDIAEACHADGDRDGARAAIDAARLRLHARADAIVDAGARAHYLDAVATHARIEQLAQLWRVDRA